MHGPGLFLIILRKGLGLFFERAIHKSARCPNAQTSQKNSDFPQAWDSSGSNNIVVFLTIQYYCLPLRHE